MRVVFQRVRRAAVEHVEDGRRAAIGPGAVLLVGFQSADDEATIEWMAEKCLGLRVFADAAGAMNRSVDEAGGALLVVPNFTLYADARKGRRPSFTDAAPPERASAAFERFVARLRRGPVPIEVGWFQAHMAVEIVNDGPITILLER